MAPAAPPGPRIELQGRIPSRDGGGGLGCRWRQGRPTEIGVKDHSGGVDHGPKPRLPQLLDDPLDGGPTGLRLSDSPAATLLFEDALDREPNQGPAMGNDQ